MSLRSLRPGDRQEIANRLRLSTHALYRAAERFIRLTDIQRVIRFGRCRACHRGLQFRLDDRIAGSARGLVVIVVQQGRIATVYREEG